MKPFQKRTLWFSFKCLGALAASEARRGMKGSAPSALPGRRWSELVMRHRAPCGALPSTRPVLLMGARESPAARPGQRGQERAPPHLDWEVGAGGGASSQCCRNLQGADRPGVELRAPAPMGRRLICMPANSPERGLEAERRGASEAGGRGEPPRRCGHFPGAAAAFQEPSANLRSGFATHSRSHPNLGDTRAGWGVRGVVHTGQ